VSRLFRKNYLLGREVIPGNCNFGQLTDVGWNQHVALGAQYHSLYIDEYKFLDPVFNSHDIAIRSSDIPRTLQSAQAQLMGMFPTSNSGSPSIPVIDIFTIDTQKENMYINQVLCPAIGNLEKQIENLPEYVQFEQKQASFRQNLIAVLNMTNSTFPSWGGLLDSLHCMMCHNLVFPKGISQDDLDQVEKNANWEWNFDLQSRAMIRLSVGSFVQEILEHMQDNINGKKQPKWMLFSAHDTTVGPLMAAMRLYDGMWPPYASHIEMELWSDGRAYFVQVKYQGIPLVPPGCPSRFCPFDKFADVLEDILPVDFWKECH